jgi:hypothetical protein
MMRASVVFFLIGIVSLLLGLTHQAGVSFELGRTLLDICLALAIGTFVMGWYPASWRSR